MQDVADPSLCVYVKLPRRGIGHHCFAELSCPDEYNKPKNHTINLRSDAFVKNVQILKSPSATITWYSSITGAVDGLQ